MSVYRQARPARPGLLAAVAIVALIAGGVVGFAVRGGGEEPSLRDAVADLRDEMRPAVLGLDVLPIEYSEAVRDGRVVAQTEYDGARGHLARARKAFDGSRSELELLAPAETARVGRELDELGALVERRAEAAEVEAAARRAGATLRAALRER